MLQEWNGLACTNSCCGDGGKPRVSGGMLDASLYCSAKNVERNEPWSFEEG